MPDLGSSPIGDDVLEQVEKVIKAIRPAIQADEGPFFFFFIYTFRL